MKAKVISRTEKAVKVDYCCEILGEQYEIRGQWLPISQLTEINEHDGVIEFNAPQWLIDKKTRDYVRCVKDTYHNLSNDMQAYLFDTSYHIDTVWC